MFMYFVEAIKKDFVARHLRCEANNLDHMLDDVEEENRVDCDYVRGSLREIEAELRRIRELCAN